MNEQQELSDTTSGAHDDTPDDNEPVGPEEARAHLAAAREAMRTARRQAITSPA